MTRIYFVRHAEPDRKWNDDRTKPLSDGGLVDRMTIIEKLENKNIQMVFSSPYKRSYDTIEPVAKKIGLEIVTDERFRERKPGKEGNNIELFKKLWSDFSHCEEEGESIGEVQNRNIEALKEVLDIGKDNNIIIGTHGTALSTILNYYDSNFGFDEFLRIINFMPYMVRLEFNENGFLGMEEEYYMEKEYKVIAQ
jgi:2,3-bisphosphoglycerate-dependent phosphoglycerate mutase